MSITEVLVGTALGMGKPKSTKAATKAEVGGDDLVHYPQITSRGRQTLCGLRYVHHVTLDDRAVTCPVCLERF